MLLRLLLDADSVAPGGLLLTQLCAARNRQLRTVDVVCVPSLSSSRAVQYVISTTSSGQHSLHAPPLEALAPFREPLSKVTW